MNKKNNTNILWHVHSLTQEDKEVNNGHQGVIFWFTGFSSSGKSTIAGTLEELLYAWNISTCLLDCDNMRHGLCCDLGFSDHERHENIRRIGELSKIMMEVGLVVLNAFISPNRTDRNWIECFIDTPLSICESRDKKGLYKRTRDGMVINFTGMNTYYEVPLKPDIYIFCIKFINNLLEPLLNILFCRNIIKI